MSTLIRVSEEFTELVSSYKYEDETMEEMRERLATSREPDVTNGRSNGERTE